LPWQFECGNGVYGQLRESDGHDGSAEQKTENLRESAHEAQYTPCTSRDGRIYGSRMTTRDDTTGIQNPYEEEAKKRWGHTQAWTQSQERVKKMSKEDFARVGKEADDLLRALALLMDRDPANPDVQGLVAKHYAGLRHFYEPNLEMYRGLGSLYVDDGRFTAHFDKIKPGLAVFLRDAMHAYCDRQPSA
jgi:hypothetical protein